MDRLKFYECKVDGLTCNVFQRSKYTDFIEQMGLQKLLIESGYRSPKNFIKERHMDKWIAYQVAKRMGHG